jgi:hypothetical protein
MNTDGTGFYTYEKMAISQMHLKSYHYRPQGRRTIGRAKKRWRE